MSEWWGVSLHQGPLEILVRQGPLCPFVLPETSDALEVSSGLPGSLCSECPISDPVWESCPSILDNKALPVDYQYMAICFQRDEFWISSGCTKIVFDFHHLSLLSLPSFMVFYLLTGFQSC